MSASPERDPKSTLPLADARRVDEICRQFEAAWRSQEQPPRIEDFVQQMPDADAHVLLRELIAVEMELRQMRGETVSLAEYERRFPGLEPLFQELSQSGLTSFLEKSAGQPVAGFLVPGQPFGPYRIVREIGRGGMGVVYEAVHGPLDRRVALKVLPTNPLWHAQQTRRFEREARTVARLQHPHIVPLLEVGEFQGIPFFTMPFVDGKNLSQLLEPARSRGKSSDQTPSAAESGPLAVFADPAAPDYIRAVARLGMQVAEALHYSHEQGVLHRDVKPSNLMLDNSGWVWVTDFGLARTELEDATLTGSGQMVGTPRYLAPENFTGKWEPAGDIYSLGATLYELLTLRPAFPATDQFQLLDQIARVNPTPPARLNPAVPPALEVIVLRAMDRKASRRPASAGELAGELRRFLAMPSAPPRRARIPQLVKAAGAWLVAVLFLGLILWNLFSTSGPTPGPVTSNLPGKSAAILVTELPGLVVRPQPLPGNRPWQIVSLQNRSSLWSVVWSPDGKLLACAGDEGIVRIFDTTGPSLQPHRFLLGHKDRIRSMAWNSAGLLATAGDDRTVRVWHADGRLLRIFQGHTGPITDLSWHPDNNRLASCGNDRTLRVWDVAQNTGKLLVQDPTSGIRQATWSPDGGHLAAAVLDTVWVWRDDGQPVARFNHGHHLRAVAWHPRGTGLASSGQDLRVKLWRLGEPAAHAVLDIPARELAWHSDGDRLATIAEKSTHEVVLWKADGTRLKTPWQLERGEFSCLRWSPDGRQLALGSLDGAVRVWSEQGRQELLCPGPPIRNPGISWSPDGSQLATGGPLAVWSADGSRVQRIAGAEECGDVDWNATGRWIGSYKENARETCLWSPAGKAGPVLRTRSPSAFSPDGNWLACLTVDGQEFYILDLHGKPGPKAPGGVRGPFHSGFAWHPSGDRLALTELGNVRLWRLEEDAGPQIIGQAGIESVGAPAWSPDGKWLAASNYTRVLLFREDGSPHLSWEAHTDQMEHLRWSPDGRWIVSCGYDRTVRFWTPEGKPGPVLELPHSMPRRLAWNYHGQLAVIGEEGNVVVWQLEPGGQLRPLWSGLLVGDGAITFGPTGEVLLGKDLLEDHFVHVVVDGNGAQQLVHPAEFKKLMGTKSPES